MIPYIIIRSGLHFRDDNRRNAAPGPTLATVTLERDGHVLLVGLDRPDKRNAFTAAMLADLVRAYALLENDDDLRVGVLFEHGEHFTAGLDLVDLAPYLARGRDPMPVDGRDPWRLDGAWTKPVVATVHGRCLKRRPARFRGC